MKILYIGNKLAQRGLTPTTVDTLGKQLQEIADVVTVSSKKNKILRLIDMCSAVFRHRKADYVIIDTYSSSAFTFAVWTAKCCRMLHKRYIPILHGGNLPSRLDKSPKLCHDLFDKAFINVSPSGYLKYEFEQRGYKNIKVISNTIEITNYQFKERSELRPKILWVRSFAKVYNCNMAIEVLKQLITKYPDAELCMVGPDKDGSMEEAKELVQKYGLTGKVTFTGRLSKRDWCDLSAQYDIFINTTNADNMPVSLIEGMALGLPIVSTNVGGVPYLVKEEEGILVEKNDVQGMVSAIDFLISNPENTRKICLAGRHKAETFDWMEVKKAWSHLLFEN